MLQLSSSVIEQPVMSLRTGGQIATGSRPIINPNNLKIEGFFCFDRYDKKQLILLTQDIRDHVKQGFVVNDHEVLAEETELIRLQPVLKLEFELIGKHVVTINKQRLGKVTDYAVDDISFYIQKIYVSQSLLKSFSGGNLSIDREQIIEITDHKIIVQDTLKTVKSNAPATAPLAG